MSFDPICHLRQIFSCVLQEVRSSAVGFERGVILILFVNEETARLGPVPVYLIH